jgi:hypothetical protein
MMVTAAYADGAFRLRIQAGCREEVTVLLTFTLDGRTIRCESQDQDLIIEATIGKGGARA